VSPGYCRNFCRKGQRLGDMPSAVREAITGVWGEAPEGLWQCPWSWSQGASPLKLKTLKHFYALRKTQNFVVNTSRRCKYGTGRQQTDAVVISWPTMVHPFCLAACLLLVMQVPPFPWLWASMTLRPAPSPTCIFSAVWRMIFCAV